MRFARLTALAILTLTLLAAPLAAEAQQKGKVYRVGWVTTAPLVYIANFREGMRELGYVEGQNVVIEQRYGGPEKLTELAEELARSKADLIVASGSAAVRAAQKVSVSVPVVFVTGDPVGDRVAVNLARSGGHMTDLALLNPEVSAKWIELIKETLPKASRIGVLLDPGSTPSQPMTAESAARSLGLHTATLEAGNVDDVERAFQTAARERVDAIVPLSSAFFNSQRERIVSLAVRYRIPAVYENRQYVEIGGLMSYGPDYRDVFKRLAGYADKVLRGTRPADLPVEQPTKFELVINLKTAKALGLTIPPAVLARADDVIQ
jgi:putative ABC transport system substrate-binding protein